MKSTSTIIALLLALSQSYSQLAIKGELVHTMKGSAIPNGIVLVKGSTIEAVGPASSVTIPEGYRVMEARVVTPGIIDAHSVVGLAGIYNYKHDQMQLEGSEAFQPELRAIDAYNPREKLVEFVRTLGVTTLHTGHAPGALASGTTIIVKSVGNTVHEAMIDSVGMIAFTLGESVLSNYKNPGTSAKAVAIVRSEFLKAQDYLKKKSAKDADKRPAIDLRMEMIAQVLKGERTVLMTAQKATDIVTAIRLMHEFKFRMVLDGAAEAYLVLDEIKKSGVPIILHPTMVRTYGDTRNASYTTAATLKEAGIPFAFQSGYEGYVPKTRIVTYEASVAAANGLSAADALAAMTINAAHILGIDKRVGSLEVGKDADIVLFDGDPLEYITHVCGVIVNGAIVSETCR